MFVGFCLFITLISPRSTVHVIVSFSAETSRIGHATQNIWDLGAFAVKVWSLWLARVN